MTTSNIYAGVPSKLFEAHTYTRTVTELIAYEVLLLYRSLYLFSLLVSFQFWDSTSRYRSPNQEALAPVIVNGSRRLC